MLQRTEEWHEARRGRFTASEIVRLLGKEGLKRTNQSIDSFAFEKALEIVHGIDTAERYLSEDMQRGISHEPLAFSLFQENKKWDFIQVQNTGFHKYGEHGGASPDGLPSNNSNLEIKCPRRANFFKIVANGVSEVDPKYIAQMQKQMLATKTEKTYFFNYYLENGTEYYNEIIIPRDEVMIKLIENRIKIASEIKLEYVEKLKTNTRF